MTGLIHDLLAGLAGHLTTSMALRACKELQL